MKGSLCEQTVKKGGTTRFRPRPFVRTGAFCNSRGEVQAFHACMESLDLCPPRHEEKAIFKENQPSPMSVELRELRSSGAIRELHK